MQMLAEEYPITQMSEVLAVLMDVFTRSIRGWHLPVVCGPGKSRLIFGSASSIYSSI